METENRWEGKQEQEKSHTQHQQQSFCWRNWVFGHTSVSDTSASDTPEEQVLATATLQLQKQNWHLFSMNSANQYFNLAVPFA